jgi:hypothetical protein
MCDESIKKPALIVNIGVVFTTGGFWPPSMTSAFENAWPFATECPTIQDCENWEWKELRDLTE